ncbi:MAG TPA: hypothetical protein VIC84_02540 [Blastocatellia bacterium]
MIMLARRAAQLRGGTVSASNAPGGAGGGPIVEIKLPAPGAVS